MVMFTDGLDMAIVVDLDLKPQTKQTRKMRIKPAALGSWEEWFRHCTITAEMKMI